MIDHISKLDFDKTYSYADYLNWKFEERLELIKGKIFRMSPAPSRLHQKVAFRLTLVIGNFLEGKKCELYPAPFDVRLIKPNSNTNQDEKILTVVQPDLCLICDPNKLDAKGCLGAPDLIIEILSPGNNKKELDNKFMLYQENLVREYWIVHPVEQTVSVFELNEQQEYQLRKMYASEGLVPVGIFPDLQIDLEEVFTE